MYKFKSFANSGNSLLSFLPYISVDRLSILSANSLSWRIDIFGVAENPATPGNPSSVPNVPADAPADNKSSGPGSGFPPGTKAAGGCSILLSGALGKSLEGSSCIILTNSLTFSCFEALICPPNSCNLVFWSTTSNPSKSEIANPSFSLLSSCSSANVCPIPSSPSTACNDEGLESKSLALRMASTDSGGMRNELFNEIILARSASVIKPLIFGILAINVSFNSCIWSKISGLSNFALSHSCGLKANSLINTISPNIESIVFGENPFDFKIPPICLKSSGLNGTPLYDKMLLPVCWIP